MKQQCVYFHTEKPFSKAKKILKDDGVEILFAAKSAEVPIHTLTLEEKDAWEDYLHQQLVESIPELEQTTREMDNVIMELGAKRTAILEIIKTFHEDPSNKKTLRMLQTTMRKRFVEDDIMRVTDGLQTTASSFLSCKPE